MFQGYLLVASLAWSCCILLTYCVSLTFLLHFLINKRRIACWMAVLEHPFSIVVWFHSIDCLISSIHPWSLNETGTDWHLCLVVPGCVNHTFFQTHPKLNNLIVLSLFLYLTWLLCLSMFFPACPLLLTFISVCKIKLSKSAVSFLYSVQPWIRNICLKCLF